MIGDRFTVSDKEYIIKKELTLGEHRQINRVNSRLAKLSENIDSPDKQIEISSASEEQLQLVCDFLESHLGLSQEEMNQLSLNESMKVFQECYKISVTPDRDLKKTSNSQ